jgi:hypothetical protein
VFTDSECQFDLSHDISEAAITPRLRVVSEPRLKHGLLGTFNRIAAGKHGSQSYDKHREKYLRLHFLGSPPMEFGLTIHYLFNFVKAENEDS